MSTIINGTSSAITFPDSSVQNTAFTGSAATLTSGTLPAARLPAGSVLQVVQGTLNGQTTYNSPTSFTQTSLTASITPTSASSKILVIMGNVYYNSSSGQNFQATIYRNNSTNISPNSGNAFPVSFIGGATEIKVPFTINYLDSPATTSSTSYTCWVRVTGGNLSLGDGSGAGTVILMEIAA
jgi:hypothetical protein